MRIYFAISFLFFSQLLLAQIVNIEQARMRTDTLGWAGHVDASFQSVKYDKSFVTASFKATAQLKQLKNTWLLLGDFGFSAGGSERFNNAALGHLRFNRKIHRYIRWEVFSQVQQNQLLDLDLRLLNGTGPRFILLQEEIGRIYLGVLYMSELERVKGATELRHTHRSSSYISLNMKGKTLSYSGTVYYQPRLFYFSDFRLSGQHTFAFAINQRWKMKLELNHFYDTAPPLGVVKSTFATSMGVAVELGK